MNTPQRLTTLEMMQRALRVRRSIDGRLDALMRTPEDGRFWRAFELYKRACRLELRLVERRVGPVTPATRCWGLRS